MKSIEATGKTVEDAVKAGLKELGCDSADVKIDVLHMGSPGLFGMFGHLAKVRLTRKEQDAQLDFEMPQISLAPVKPAQNARQEKSVARAQSARPAEPALPAESAQPAEPVRPVEPAPVEQAEPAQVAEIARPAQAAPEQIAPRAREALPRRQEPRPLHSREARPRPKRAEAQRASAPIEEVGARPAHSVSLRSADTLSEPAKRAVEFLIGATEKMGVGVDIDVDDSGEVLSIQMTGDTLGILIGRRGDTLDALQYLTSLTVNRQREEYVRISLDCEHYRKRREEALVKLATRMAARARKSGHKVVLEPMNPYERRILHSALQSDPNVQTHSEGEEPFRHVVITLKREDAAAAAPDASAAQEADADA